MVYVRNGLTLVCTENMILHHPLSTDGHRWIDSGSKLTVACVPCAVVTTRFFEFWLTLVVTGCQWQSQALSNRGEEKRTHARRLMFQLLLNWCWLAVNSLAEQTACIKGQTMIPDWWNNWKFRTARNSKLDIQNSEQTEIWYWKPSEWIWKKLENDQNFRRRKFRIIGKFRTS